MPHAVALANGPAIINTLGDLRSTIARWRAAGEIIALVPTMGALHAGHISLVREAQKKAQRVIVSIFVNPAQFAPHEDFSRYPRTFDADVNKLSDAGADAVWSPDVETMYPGGFCTTVALAGPAVAGLEDRFRPTHFAGVATVVAKLHIQVAPDIAIYGEKDFQQLAVIRQMTRDLNQPVEVMGAPTMRELDGLAMSSRNVYLSAADRKRAPLLHRTMQECANRIRNGEAMAQVMDEGREIIRRGGFE
ncbi:MAG: pantoate--beta-alanine ligase, partial [Alphaproteobacteria bacterium]|nr:pantoate--beta-alanine ligase [Alphaproteobacteria bacterium]